MRKEVLRHRQRLQGQTNTIGVYRDVARWGVDVCANDVLWAFWRKKILFLPRTIFFEFSSIRQFSEFSKVVEELKREKIKLVIIIIIHTGS
jgi:hypothetical protein